MIAKYDEYWDVIHGVFIVETILDPRHKMLLINFLFPKIYGEKAESEIEMVHKLFVDIMHEYEVKHSSNSGGGVNGYANSQATTTGDSIVLDLNLDEISNKWASFRNESTTQNNHLKTELEFYLEVNTLPSTS